MIRVSGLKRQVVSRVNELSSDGMGAQEQREAICKSLCTMLKELYDHYNYVIIPKLEGSGIKFYKYEELSEENKKVVDKYFDEELFPVLTPIAIDYVHPFPQLVNRTLALALTLVDPETENLEEKISAVQVPSNFPRLHPLTTKGISDSDTGSEKNFIFLEDIIKANAYKLFPGMKISSCYSFRITRNADIELEEEEAGDLLTLIEEEVKKRRLGIVVRLEVEKDISEKFLSFLVQKLNLDDTEVFRFDGPLNLGDLMNLMKLDYRKLKDEPFTPRISSSFREEKDFFKAIRKKDVFLHHPFYSFSSVSEFIAQAAEDPDVFAIKLILYRTSGDSPIIKSLIEAAENGKQVTAVVELKARFDEENNIVWARALENAGVHVVYGISGLKTHCKMALVVRKENKVMKRYLHLSTGNYNPITARIYTDFGLFTADEEFCKDSTNLFNYLTGYSKQVNYKKLLVAPFSMRKQIIKLIDDEIKSHKKDNNGHIVIKTNSLVDEETICKLYEASNEGLRIDLLVRGICRLKPQIEGLSENINVYSIVGRFLEHSRAYYFYNDGNPILYTGSADVMQRNFDRRVEILFPIEDSQIKNDIIKILMTYLRDDVKTRILTSEGKYLRKAELILLFPHDFSLASPPFNKLDNPEESLNAQEFFVSKVKKKHLEEMKKEHRKKHKKRK